MAINVGQAMYVDDAPGSGRHSNRLNIIHASYEANQIGAIQYAIVATGPWSDLIPAECTAALSTLPDKVEAFDMRLAQGILRRELGPSKYQRLVPNANIQASIGQVCKVPLVQHGKSFVVKIQRRSVLAEIALDLYLGREYGVKLYECLFPGAVTESDARAICTEWGRGLIGKLDYRDKVRNTRCGSTWKCNSASSISVVMVPTVCSGILHRASLGGGIGRPDPH
jgi:predicted unusual protein kinase regulating ubiquinone biosynthesis (AarF/ABC1/UbiB family)